MSTVTDADEGRGILNRMWREIAEKSGKQKSQKCSALMAVRSIWNVVSNMDLN